MGAAVVSIVGLLVLLAASVFTDRALAAPRRCRTRVDIERHRAPVVVGGRATRDADAARTFTTANEIHIPVGPAGARSSCDADDVIHSFWVPNLAGKKDLIPGRTDDAAAPAPTSAGVYRGQCAEFCGCSTR